MESASIFTGYISWFLGVCISTLLALAGKYWVDIFLNRKARQISCGCYGIDDGFLLTITLCNTSNKTMRIDKPGLLHRKEHGLDRWVSLWAIRGIRKLGIFHVDCSSDQIDLKIMLDGSPTTMEEVCGPEIKIDSYVSWHIHFKTVKAAELFMEDCDSLGFMDRRGAFYSVRAKPIRMEIKDLVKDLSENPLSPKSPNSRGSNTLSVSFSQLENVIMSVKRVPDKQPEKRSIEK